jgi:uncharacterized protein (TIGR02246 family)
MRVLPLLLTIALAVPCRPVLGQQRAPDEAAIRKSIAALETALNAHDASGGARLFAEDGDQIVRGSAQYRGRAEIERAYREKRLAIPTGKHIAITVRSIRFISPDVALVDVEGHLVEMPSTSKDRAFYVMVRGDGSWQIAALRVYAPEST